MQDIRLVMNKIIDEFVDNARVQASRKHDIRPAINHAINTHARNVNVCIVAGNLGPYQLLQHVRYEQVRS
jgi:hypothetical protein